MKNILLVVDMQNGFARYEQTKVLKQKIFNLLQLEKFDYVIATRFLNTDNSVYERWLKWNKLKDQHEQAIDHSYLKYIDFVVDKNVYNCINQQFLDKLYEINNNQLPDKIYIVGADTDCCILIVATALFENNIRPVVLLNYCASNGGELAHNAGILCLKRLIGKDQLVDVEITEKLDLSSL
ncbi:isochorismatase [Ureaplasma diversum]|uniref:Isochorismatase n=1 Tax=Ureaplasma diversum TaxID=42094 RepID=A0A0C5RLR1_9BACT|nr:isochorismatase family protein [Ureaplasma diversum]AJQ45357.1 isochorismatase [Ureaplasma diversum]